MHKLNAGKRARQSEEIYTDEKNSYRSSGDAIYLHVYENACPAAVSFVKGEDKSVSAGGTFIINDGFDASTPESLQEFFGETGAVIESVPLD